MTVTSNFSQLPDAGFDPILELMTAHAADPNPGKIDVSVGVYKTEDGDPNYVFPCVDKAKKVLAANDPGHCYTLMSGIAEFVSAAQRTIFGTNHSNVVSVQAISGSGALHLALCFLRGAGFSDFYVGVPAWSNYEGMVEHVGGKFHTYNYYDRKTNAADFASVVDALKAAPAKSVFILQAVCHNPTGCDYTHEQWSEIFSLIKERDIFPLFDIAYQGFASGSTDTDAWAVREAYRLNLEFAACQSYSKNMGLYSERVGCTHVCVQDEDAVSLVLQQLVAYIRREISFAPAFGARVSAIIQNDEELTKVWKEDVLAVTKRLQGVRQTILDTFTKLQTPGNWDHVVKQNGLFWFSGLTPLQVQKLREEHHIYGTLNGRVNVAGLNKSNILAYCKAVDAVVREHPWE